MLPFIKSLTSIDTYRDGGSMSISFISLTGIEHTLLFPVRNSPGNENGTKTYAEPVLEIFRKTKRVSHVTGLERVDINALRTVHTTLIVFTSCLLDRRRDAEIAIT